MPAAIVQAGTKNVLAHSRSGIDTPFDTDKQAISKRNYEEHVEDNRIHNEGKKVLQSLPVLLAVVMPLCQNCRYRNHCHHFNHENENCNSIE